MAKREVEIREGRFFDVKKRCKIALAEFTPKFLEWAKTSKKSWERDETSLRNLSEHLAEIERLLAECADHIRSVVHMALLTGMRKSEIIGLRWKRWIWPGSRLSRFES